MFNLGSFGTPSTTTSTTTSTPAVGTLFQNAGASSTASLTQPVAKEVTWTSQFDDLPPTLQEDIKKVQAFILQSKVASEELAQHSFDLVPKVRDEIEAVAERMATLDHILKNEQQAVAVLKEDIGNELKKAEMAARYVESMTTNNLGIAAMPQHNLQLPPLYFRELAVSFEKRMVQYRHVISEIEQLSFNLQRQYSPQMLQEIMNNQYEAFMGVAARVAQLHDTMQRAKEQYINLRNQYYGTNETVEDVFEKEEKRKQKEAKIAQELYHTPTPTSSFMAPVSATAPSPAPATSLWPSSTPTAAAPAATTPFGFGSSITSTPSTTTPTFGLSTPTAAPATTTTTTTGGAFGSSLFSTPAGASSTGGLGFSTASTALAFPSSTPGSLFSTGSSTTATTSTTTTSTGRRGASDRPGSKGKKKG